MIRLYEQHGIIVDESLIAQYLQAPKIAKDFAIYYDLFNKYKSDYQVDKILQGEATEEIKERAKAANFDERLALVGLLLDGMMDKLREVYRVEQILTELMTALKTVREELNRPNQNATASLKKQTIQLQEKITRGKQASTLSVDTEYALHGAIVWIESMSTELLKATPENETAAFNILKSAFDKQTKALKMQAEAVKAQLNNVFIFCEKVFGDGQEMLILVTELTISHYAVHFISRYGCEKYFAHNKELLFYERQKDIIQQLENFEL